MGPTDKPSPCLGDIRATKDYPPGTPLSEITEFEVWDGEKWIKASADQPIYQVEDGTH